jgi:hypothetical protein
MAVLAKELGQSAEFDCCWLWHLCCCLLKSCMMQMMQPILYIELGLLLQTLVQCCVGSSFAMPAASIVGVLDYAAVLRSEAVQKTTRHTPSCKSKVPAHVRGHSRILDSLMKRSQRLRREELLRCSAANVVQPRLSLATRNRHQRGTMLTRALCASLCWISMSDQSFDGMQYNA